MSMAMTAMTVAIWRRHNDDGVDDDAYDGEDGDNDNDHDDDSADNDGRGDG